MEYTGVVRWWRLHSIRSYSVICSKNRAPDWDASIRSQSPQLVEGKPASSTVWLEVIHRVVSPSSTRWNGRWWAWKILVYTLSGGSSRDDDEWNTMSGLRVMTICYFTDLEQASFFDASLSWNMLIRWLTVKVCWCIADFVYSIRSQPDHAASYQITLVQFLPTALKWLEYFRMPSDSISRPSVWDGDDIATRSHAIKLPKIEPCLLLSQFHDNGERRVDPYWNWFDVKLQ